MSVYKTIGSLRSDSNKALGIFLHGFGASSEDIYNVAKYFTQSVEDWLVPDGIIDMSNYVGQPARAWFPNTHKDIIAAMKGEYWKDLASIDDPSITYAAAHIYAILVERAVTHRPLVLAGFSQGAMLCCELILLLMQYSLSVPAMLLFSGALIAEQRWASTVHEISKGDTLKELSIAQFHGEHDTVLTLSSGRSLNSFWKKCCNSVQFHVFDGTHSIPVTVLNSAQQFLSETLSK